MYLHSCGAGSSFFRLIDHWWPETGSRHTFHRICTLMRIFKAETIVRNEGQSDPAVLRELKAVKTRLGQKNVDLKAYQFLFVRRDLVPRKAKGRFDNNVGLQITELEFQAAKVTSQDVLGVVTIINVTIGKFAKTYVFESIIADAMSSAPVGTELGGRPPWAAYLHIKRHFRIRFANEEYSVLGTYFCQQNAITNVCAHVCCVMMLNNGRGQDLVHCEDINEILGIDHRHRQQEIAPAELGDNTLATHEGLYPREVCRVFRAYGFRPYTLRTGNLGQPNHREFVYSFIESGFPALLNFNYINCEENALAHVVAIVGHTLNRHSWFPNAYASYGQGSVSDFIPALSWVNDFIVHDDNLGMQLSLPAHAFKSEGSRDRTIGLLPTHVIGILPDAWNVNFPGHSAQELATYILSLAIEQEGFSKEALAENYYTQRLFPNSLGSDRAPFTAVVRCFLAAPEKYVESLNVKDNKGSQYTGDDLDILRKFLRDREAAWVVEFTEPELYVGNGSKVFDLLVDATMQPADVQSKRISVLMRMPHCFVEAILEKDKLETFTLRKTAVSGHLPLFGL